MSELILDQPRCDSCHDQLNAGYSEGQMVLLDVGVGEPAVMRTPEESDIEKMQALYRRLSTDDIRLRFLGYLSASTVADICKGVSSLGSPERAYDIVVEHDKTIIAHGGVILDNHTDIGDLHFVVDPDFRGKKIANYMVDNTIRSAQALRVSKLCAITAPKNPPMQKSLTSAPKRLGLNPAAAYRENGYFRWTLNLADSSPTTALCALNGLACHLDATRSNEPPLNV